mmetsp:Transcript_29382/g.39106  ORF Transcript_29382/g.39106 Transcript_29382/m.39106 type:complete len:112 (-) Transcript_29382:57-392(-)|eukprot:CAMPEP_0185581086 /NCGR_PEP_ID=MMETSP0434-20130131/18093_1 /TAXON_ID=626734 ORGANISM="Favella taraikaensis, Strain Fe Narragansett Bay" /NCGR_SAMPLE_ID=MMETSP0434 /ASSEMBLY_ACC=CAM_ASM_000379 /LENGTH=111 /DNA_ID=CAMNT_0028199537 /DNA_START=198 /DNA_END=533 /DNA_ORIENTATION=+
MTWRFNEQVTVTTVDYGFDKDDDSKCVKKKGSSSDFYAKNTIEYTARSPWPYNEDNVCATHYEVTNDDKDRESTVTFYTFPDGYTEDPSPLGSLQTSFAVALLVSLGTLAY